MTAGGTRRAEAGREKCRGHVGAERHERAE